MPPSETTIEAPLRHVHKPLQHDSGAKHVQGSAEYIDDMLEPAGTLHIALGGSPVARGVIRHVDLADVLSVPGVVTVITAAHIPGRNDISPAHADEPVFAHDRVDYHNQPIFAVVATTRDTARRAALRGKIEIAVETPNVSVEQGKASGERVLPDYAFVGGDAAKAIAEAPFRLSGTMHIGGQEHFYLEGQIAVAVPGEDGAILVYSSTQHPSEVQHIVARVLAVPDAFITCRVRRMGGGFGGKETQATQWAVIAALAARTTGKPCKLRLDRDADMAITGKRHDFAVQYSVGYEDDGRISALDLDMDARCGCSVDLSVGVVDRAMFHADNAYFLPEFKILTRRVKTNTVSNTAFRGFGGPQGIMAIERVIDAIAWECGLDPLDVRKANLYRPGRQVTPYGQTVEDYDIAAPLIDELERTSSYRARRNEIRLFNETSPIIKRWHRADAGQIRHLVYAHPSQSGGRADQRLSGWFDQSQSRRHRNGPGPVSENCAGDRGRVRRRIRARADHRHLDRQGAEHFGDGGFVGHRPQRNGGANRGAQNQKTADKVRQRDLEGAGGSHHLP